MTRIHHFDDGVTPPLDLDAIERRRAERSPAEDAARQAHLDAWQIGRDAFALGEQQLAAGYLERARDAFAIAARHQAPDAADLLHTVTELLDVLDNSIITDATADTALARTPTDPDDEPDMIALRAQDLVHRLDQLKARIERLAADARSAHAAITDARTRAAAILDETRTQSATILETAAKAVRKAAEAGHTTRSATHGDLHPDNVFSRAYGDSLMALLPRGDTGRLKLIDVSMPEVHDSLLATRAQLAEFELVRDKVKSFHHAVEAARGTAALLPALTVPSVLSDVAWYSRIAGDLTPRLPQPPLRRHLLIVCNSYDEVLRFVKVTSRVSRTRTREPVAPVPRVGPHYTALLERWRRTAEWTALDDLDEVIDALHQDGTRVASTALRDLDAKIRNSRVDRIAPVRELAHTELLLALVRDLAALW
ncbi:hypothetical protein [Saccharothrix luteola]|uniref:hypothetical protein n=1 Tax=Saccharothrix luteola TaxID=2893018 RepID=UPI001E440D85|nr:hypothetical protein [Saccharothrix luteola]MCC8247646.1 hypothetical protein [Saccharothrix luteola]